MVDIIKSLPSVPTLFPSNIHRVKNRSPSEQISLPIFFSTVNKISQNDRTIIINNTKRWIGRCPGDLPRQLNISYTPYTIHRKVIYHELARYYPATTNDMSTSIKTKQQQKNSNKESLKITTTGTTVPSTTVLSNFETQNSRLSNALSKHITIKAEPLRPTNNFINNTNNILSSWQQYWASTHTQRRRKEANDSESMLYPRLQREQPLLSTTHFITVRDSSFYKSSENISISRIPSTIPSSCNPSKLSSSIISDKQSSFIKEENHFISLPEIISSSIIDSPREKTSPMNSLKSIEEKSLSPIQSENTIIIDDNEIENAINTITTKMYKLPLPLNKPKMNKSITKKESRSKSLEKNAIIPPILLEKKASITTFSSNTSFSKQKNQTTSKKPHRITTTTKQQSLSTVMTTTPRSKYERKKWDQPYVGVRFDPPTPPCSPSLFVWPQDSDQDENDGSFEQNSANKVSR